jgi:nucleoside-diphosphate-sugar epimerase
MNSEKIIITGATGLLGDHLTKYLSSKYEVFAVVRSEPKKRIEGVSYIVIDFETDWSTEVLPNDVKAVIHLAQSNKFRDFPESSLSVFRVNIESTAKLIEYARKHSAESFIYFSSGGVYGNGPGEFYENSPIIDTSQLDYYLGSKVCSEVLLQSYASFLNLIIVRPFFMYGSGQKSQMLIPRLINRVKNGEAITLDGEEGISINPVHVKDAVSLVSECIQNPPQSSIMNLAGPDILSLKEIAHIIGDKVSKQPVFEYKDSKPSDLVGNNSLMVKMLKEELVPFRDGVDDLI